MLELAREPLGKIDGNFAGKHIVSFDQFTPQSLDHLFKVTDQLKPKWEDAEQLYYLTGQSLILLFFEASSRTKGSFDVAAKQMGANVTVVDNPMELSSFAKNESFEDSIKVFETQSDSIIMRHPETGSAKKAAEALKRSTLINAGDGKGEHPSQTLLDLYTIKQHTQTLDGIGGLIAGDLLRGRTVHSLLKGLSMHKRNEIFLFAPDRFKLPQEEVEEFRKRGLGITIIEDLSEVPSVLDFWYWTRAQTERSEDGQKKSRKNKTNDAIDMKYAVNKRLLDAYASKHTILMHPLPRNEELNKDLDNDPRSIYLTEQMRNGIPTRMALLGLTLGKID